MTAIEAANGQLHEQAERMKRELHDLEASSAAVQALSTRQRQLEMDVAALQTESNGLRDSIGRARSEKETLVRAVESMHRELQSTTEHLASIQGQEEAARGELMAQRMSERQEVEKLQDKAKQLNSEMASAAHALADLQASREEAKGECEMWMREKRTLAVDVENASRQEKSARQDLERMFAQLDGERGALRGLEEERHLCSERVRHEEAELKRTRGERVGEEKQLAEVRRDAERQLVVWSGERKKQEDVMHSLEEQCQRLKVDLANVQLLVQNAEKARIAAEHAAADALGDAQETVLRIEQQKVQRLPLAEESDSGEKALRREEAFVQTVFPSPFETYEELKGESDRLILSVGNARREHDCVAQRVEELNGKRSSLEHQLGEVSKSLAEQQAYLEQRQKMLESEQQSLVDLLSTRNEIPPAAGAINTKGALLPIFSPEKRGDYTDVQGELRSLLQELREALRLTVRML